MLMFFLMPDAWQSRCFEGRCDTYVISRSTASKMPKYKRSFEIFDICNFIMSDMSSKHPCCQRRRSKELCVILSTSQNLTNSTMIASKRSNVKLFVNYYIAPQNLDHFMKESQNRTRYIGTFSCNSSMFCHLLEPDNILKQLHDAPSRTKVDHAALSYIAGSRYGFPMS